MNNKTEIDDDLFFYTFESLVIGRGKRSFLRTSAVVGRFSGFGSIICLMRSQHPSPYSSINLYLIVSSMGCLFLIKSALVFMSSPYGCFPPHRVKANIIPSG